MVKENTKKPHRSYGARLRNNFLTGLIVCAPIVITAYLTWNFVVWVDGWAKPYIPKVYNPETYLPFGIPGLGLIFALLVITIVGFFTRNLIGRSVLNFGESILARMPLIRSIYKGLKQIFETVLAEGQSSFSKAGIIEYPRKGLWAIVFIATDTHGEVGNILKEEDTVSVFLPTTPNPTSGFLLFVPRKDLRLLDMNVEEAAKLVISAGLVSPDHEENLADKIIEE
ncbi:MULTISPECIES: DUF502 domain-containing protein [unclassified Lentilitoribacter]|jgi:uncharacterized membrane protein|uniref:DUF502 domain-containing protein n=1 Tax=unclassified Lentilitoribacter TaxID=2647570 RepID=UPI0013A6C05E|nr:DUF502 domain-containing protein [Lentilitoribacter sp. Alg239-R112]